MPLFSGKFVLRVPAKLHEKLRDISLSRRMSLNALCTQKLSELDGSESFDPPASPIPKGFLLEVQARFPGNLGAVLFGSSARQTSTESSDIDLLIVTSNADKISRQLYREFDELVEEKSTVHSHLKKISPHFVALPSQVGQTGSLWFEIALEGIILWQKDFYLSQLLNEIRREMAEGRIQRHFSHGHPYWTRKATYEE